MNLVLTKNFYSWMRTVLLGSSTSISASTSSTSGLNSNMTFCIEPMIDINGTERTYLTFASSYISRNVTLNYWNSINQSGTFFTIGSDNTPATEDDHNVGSGYVWGADYSTSHRAISNPQIVNGKGLLTFNVTFTAKTDIIIGEIGMIKSLDTSSSSSANFLFGRIALDTPIELGAGESATFQISVEI